MIVLPIVTECLIMRQFLPEDLPAYLEFMLDEESTIGSHQKHLLTLYSV